MPRHTDVILCEGELNALILRQCVAEVCAVVSVGDSGNRPGAEALASLATARRWHLAFDPDKAGMRAQNTLCDQYSRARPLPWPWRDRGEKYDINDAFLDGEDLARWVIASIGPSGDRRRAWLEHHLGRLDEPSFAAGGDESDASLRMRLALYDAWRALREGTAEEA